MKTKLHSLIITLALFAGIHHAAAQSNGSPSPTAFTYQGLLNSGTNPANSNYTMSFTLFATNSGGIPIAGPVTNSVVPVGSNLLFTTTVDFGPGVFANQQTNFFLEIGVATNGGSFITLAPRQPITPTPLSSYAQNAGTAAIANGVSASAVIQGQSLSVGQSNTLSGVLTTVAGGAYNSATLDYAVVAGGFDNTASSNNATVGGGAANVASGDYSVVAGGQGNVAFGTHSVVGGGWGNIAANDEDAVLSGVGNIVAGDPSVICGGSYNQVGILENNMNTFVHNNTLNSFIVAGAYNTNTSDYSGIGGGYYNHIQTNAIDSFIGGGSQNTIETGAGGSVISGGLANTIQTNAARSFIGGGFANQINSGAALSFIGAGMENTIKSNAEFSVISGGELNTIQTNSTECVISGGTGNTIQSSDSDSMIGGGLNNLIQSANAGSAIVGGTGNWILANASYASIGGGGGNSINSFYSVIGGGWTNLIQSSAFYATIGGGYQNLIQPNANGAVIAGGGFNAVQYAADNGVIAGGQFNVIQALAEFSVISGGYYNTIQTNDTFATIGGGTQNTIQPNILDSTIGGGIANLIASRSSSTNFFGTNYLAGNVIAGGAGNVITNASYATIAGGSGNLVLTNYTTIPGGQQAVAANYAQLAYSGGMFAKPGDSQYSLYVLRGVTDTNIPCGYSNNLYLDGQSLEIALPTNRACVFSLSVVGLTSTHLCFGYHLRGAANGSIVSSPTSTAYVPPGNEDDWANSATSGSIGQWANPEAYLNQFVPGCPGTGNPPSYPTVTVSGGFLHVSVFGDGVDNIRWTATLETTEIAY